MAEVLGTIASALTVAALFKLCIEAFELISTAQKQATDLKKLALRLDIERCRLYTWGQAMRLTETARPGKKGPLDLCPFPEVVRDTLHSILELFQDSHKLRGKYGCTTLDGPTSTTPTLEGDRTIALRELDASFDNFKMKSNSRVKDNVLIRKCYWVVHDRNKFAHLIQDAKDLIDGLQDITKDLSTILAQQESVCTRISTLNNVRTLDWIAEICEADYPAFSDAANSRADTISEVTTFHRGIQDWKDAINHDDDDEEQSDVSDIESTIAGLEDMTVTELKNTFSTFLLRRKEERLDAKRTGGLMPDTSIDFADAESPQPSPISKDAGFPDQDNLSSPEPATGGSVEFNHAIGFVDKIKARFAQQPEIYTLFLDILKTYERESRPVQEVCVQVANLFYNAPDLLEDFRYFIPEAVQPSHRLRLRNDVLRMPKEGKPMNEETLHRIIEQTASNQDYVHELDAIKQWFQVISNEEKIAVMHALGGVVTIDQLLSFNYVHENLLASRRKPNRTEVIEDFKRFSQGLKERNVEKKVTVTNEI